MTTPENMLTKEQIENFSQRIDVRKNLLLDEIRQVLARSKHEHQVDLIGGAGDSGDVAAASVMRDITQAEVVRDVEEVRDIVAAKQRIETGRYGLCIDCEDAIRFKRLDAYPTAKRCYTCQVSHEKRQGHTQP
ncbi:TraR/DksA family transcriptional regulator [Alcaligenaceae bacterium CGII-47]|nr:TraR/DksA family transcriptional regulator [Alcaligenaceae bacterium CGII-47]